MIAKMSNETIDALPLSRREKEVAGLLAKGHSNQEISLMLAISINTVKFHVKNIFDKMGVDSRGAFIYQIAERQIARLSRDNGQGRTPSMITDPRSD
jgi:DNA-binding CsgD family transcriptional regulator